MYKIAINRPIATLMYVVILSLFGYFSYKSMPSALFPNVDFPIVTIKTKYAGAEPSTIESQITDKIEEAVSSIGGVDSIMSVSSNSMSVVTVKFLLERNIEEAANDVRDKVSAVSLPEDADKPLVSKLDVGGASVINLFLTAKNATDNELMEFADKKVKPAVQKLNGVGGVNVLGYRDREIKISLNPYLLNKYGISTSELNTIIQNQNLKLSGGKIISTSKEITIKTEADSKTIDELKNINIKDNLKLKDIALIEDSLSDKDSFSSYNGVSGVMIEVQKISGTNTLEIIQKVKDALPKLQKNAGDKFGIEILNDTSLFIKSSLGSATFDLIYGVILATLIVFIFLRNFTITIVSALALPASILGTFALMSYMGYELNKLTLIGLTLAIGIIIDDAIVVVENISKKLESGMDKFQASVEGIKEISFTILAISSMLLAVFIPVAFMDGMVGKFFNSFAITIVFAIIISYTIAITFIPSFSARVLSNKQTSFYRVTEPIFTGLENIYSAILKFVLNWKLLTVIVVIATFIGSLSLFPKIGMDFVPKEDKSEFEIKIKADSKVSLEKMVEISKGIDEFVRSNKLVEFTTLSIGYTSTKDKNKASIYVKLIDSTKRDIHQEKIIQEFRNSLKKIAQEKNLFITAAAIPNIKGAGVSVPYQIILKGDNLESLIKAKDNLVKYLGEKQGFMDIDTNLEDGKPEYRLNILRANASKVGINAKEIAGAINVAFSSDVKTSSFEENGKEFDIVVKFDDKYRTDIESLKKMQLKSSSGEMVLIDGLVEFEEASTLVSINRFNRERSVNVYADLFGLDLGGAVGYTMAKINSLLPDDVSFKFSGFAEEMGKTAKSFGTAILISIILMYIILAVLYESLIQPIIIMVALPLSIVGVLVSLFLTGHHFSLFVMIGFMLLMGMVGKNAVLLVDFANHAIEKGKSVNEALVEAGRKRLRPILMTTTAMVFGMLPLVIHGGYGVETKAPMAISIIGGLISSMFLTLFIIPVIYKLIIPFDLWLKKFYSQKID